MRLDLRMIALLPLLAPAAAQAQLWSGTAAVEVRVEDQKGPPLAGAKLVLRYKALDPEDGPPPVVTDARGKAVVGGLAEGPWHLEVSHDGYMTYLAEINVREKGRIQLEEAAQFNVVGATRTMRVQITRGRSVPIARAPAPVEIPPAPEPATPAPAVPKPPRTENPPVPAPAPPRDEPAAAPPPVAEPPKPAPPPAPVEPPSPRPEIRPAPPAPAPARPTPPPPAPAPVPAPAAPPADPVRLRTAKDRTCFECPPGESALSTERVIPAGGGAGCGGDIAARLQDGRVPADLPAGCHVLRITLPEGARYTGYRYEIQVEGDGLDCLAGQSCPQNTGRWPANPVLVRDPRGTVVLAPFEAGPSAHERRAVLTVYFSTGAARRR
jgi:outer membrane biosynthesis protein TonB